MGAKIQKRAAPAAALVAPVVLVAPAALVAPVALVAPAPLVGLVALPRGRAAAVAQQRRRSPSGAAGTRS